MYIKFSFLETEVIIPHCWGGLIVNVAGKPQLMDELSAGVKANTYIKTTYANDELEAMSAVAAPDETKEEAKQSPDYQLAKKLYDLLEEAYTISSEADFEIDADLKIAQESIREEQREVNNCADEKPTIVCKDYYHDCGSATKHEVERALNVLNIFFMDLIASADLGKSLAFVADKFYPRRNLILEILTKAIAHIQAETLSQSASLVAQSGSPVFSQPNLTKASTASPLNQADASPMLR